MIRQSDSIQALAEALSKAQGEVENASKNASNPHFKSKYADLAEIINTVRPVLAKHGLAVVQFPGYADGVVTVETVLTHKSGEWMAGVSGAPIGKADPQGVGSALTYLRRYSLAAVCAIAQEDDDGTAASRPREDRPDDKPRASDSKAATDKQIGFVEKLAKSSKLTEEEREGIHKRILHGMTAKQASDAIEWLTATVAEREKEDAA